MCVPNYQRLTNVYPNIGCDHDDFYSWFLTGEILWLFLTESYYHLTNIKDNISTSYYTCLFLFVCILVLFACPLIWLLPTAQKHVTKLVIELGFQICNMQALGLENAFRYAGFGSHYYLYATKVVGKRVPPKCRADLHSFIFYVSVEVLVHIEQHLFKFTHCKTLLKI